jgi:NADPH:quinone reductase-like Zn-dependent oxidoreductase
VATTSSARNLEYVAQFGADLVVNYNEQKWDELEELKGLDAVLDCVGEKEAFARTRASGVVKADGAFVSIASADAGFNPAGHPPMHFASIYTLSNSAAAQDELAGMIAAGKLTVSVNEEFPFTQEGVVALIRKVESGASTGKNILRIV